MEGKLFTKETNGGKERGGIAGIERGWRFKGKGGNYCGGGIHRKEVGTGTGEGGWFIWKVSV